MLNGGLNPSSLDWWYKQDSKYQCRWKYRDPNIDGNIDVDGNFEKNYEEWWRLIEIVIISWWNFNYDLIRLAYHF